MSDEPNLVSDKEEQLESHPLRYWRAWVPVAIILVAAMVYVFSPGTNVTKPNAAVTRTAVVEEDALRDSRAALVREPGLATCRASIDRINSYLVEHTDLQPPAVNDETRAQLAKRYGLNAGEVAELASTVYTPIDARYIEECLLFRDAARSLDLDESGSDGAVLRPTALERVTTAFNWVVRQVRPFNYDPDTLLGPDQERLPPAFTLRRGWGDPFERALAFLALLQQDAGPEHVRGCLLILPGHDKVPPRFWACGVVIGDDPQVYLFDPRPGLPLPGPGGKGIATLASAIKDPAVLAQLDSAPDANYDVKPEQARTAEARVVFSLSALSPRMRHLQETLLKNVLSARMADDGSDFERIQRAMKASGGAGAAIWQQGVGLLRRFLPQAEGGSDRGEQFMLSNLPGFTTRDDPTPIVMTHLELFEWELVPWEFMPPQFNPRDFPIRVGLGQRVREYFAVPFMQPIRDPRSSRELIVRGQYNQAVPKLVTEDNELREAIARRTQAENIDEQFGSWLKRARDLYAERQRAANARDNALVALADKGIDELWKSATPVYILLLGAAAKPRDGEVTYQLALCKQEQAEQYQARLDLLARAGVTPSAGDVERCRQTWTDAKDWWDRLAAEFPEGIAASAGRQNRGRVEAMLGNWAAAAATWGDVGGQLVPGTKLAALYRSREAKKHLAPKP